MRNWAGVNGTVFDTRRLAKRLPKLSDPWVMGNRPGLRVIELPNTFVRVRVAGEGDQTIVFACDPPNVVEQYDEVIAKLGTRYRVVCIEQPGFGFSFPKAGFGFTLAEYTDTLIALLEELDLAPYSLAFPCFSTYYAIAVAHRRPDLIRKLILMQATSWPEQKQWLQFTATFFVFATTGIPIVGGRLARIPYIGQAINAAIEPTFSEKTFGAVVYRSQDRPELLEKFLTAGRDAFTRGACNCLTSMAQRYFSGDDEGFPKPEQPALILFANRDLSHDNSHVLPKLRKTTGLPKFLAKLLVPEAHTDPQGLMKYVPHAQFGEIDKTGHHLELESPDQVCGAIGEFVGSP